MDLKVEPVLNKLKAEVCPLSRINPPIFLSMLHVCEITGSERAALGSCYLRLHPRTQVNHYCAARWSPLTQAERRRRGRPRCFPAAPACSLIPAPLPKNKKAETASGDQSRLFSQRLQVFGTSGNGSCSETHPRLCRAVKEMFTSGRFKEEAWKRPTKVRRREILPGAVVRDRDGRNV